MTDYSGLVERLREDYDCPGPDVLEHIREAAAAIEAQQRELDEARAELASVKSRLESTGEQGRWLYKKLTDLRAAVAEHDKHCRCTWFACYPPPSAAPAASEPTKDYGPGVLSHEPSTWPNLAEAGAGPKL